MTPSTPLRLAYAGPGAAGQRLEWPRQHHLCLHRHRRTLVDDAAGQVRGHAAAGWLGRDAAGDAAWRVPRLLPFLLAGLPSSSCVQPRAVKAGGRSGRRHAGSGLLVPGPDHHAGGAPAKAGPLPHQPEHRPHCRALCGVRAAGQACAALARLHPPLLPTLSSSHAPPSHCFLLATCFWACPKSTPPPPLP